MSKFVLSMDSISTAFQRNWMESRAKSVLADPVFFAFSLSEVNRTTFGAPFNYIFIFNICTLMEFFAIIICLRIILINVNPFKAQFAETQIGGFARLATSSFSDSGELKIWPLMEVSAVFGNVRGNRIIDTGVCIKRSASWAWSKSFSHGAYPAL